MPAVFTNQPTSTLTTQFNIGDVNAIVETGEGARFASPGAQEWQLVVLRNADWTASEYCKLTSRSGDTLVLDRADEGSTEQNWPPGTIIEGILTAGVLNDFAQVEAVGLDQLADVVLTNPATGEALIYDGAGWKNQHGRQLGLIIGNTVGGQSDLADVDLLGLADNHALVYQESNDTWVTRLLHLDQLSDVVLSSPVSGHILEYNGAQWINVVNPGGGGANALDDLTDVTVTAPAVDEILRYNGSQWVNAVNPGGGGGKTVISGDTTYYVDVGLGTDAPSNGRAAGASAWATIQYAIDQIAQQIDGGGNDITISVADGTYAESITLRPPSATRKLIIAGNETTPADVLLSINDTNHRVTAMGNACLWNLRGMRIRSYGSFNGAVFAERGAYVVLTNVEIGNGDTGSGNSAVGLYADSGGTIEIEGTLTFIEDLQYGALIQDMSNITGVFGQIVYANSPVMGSICTIGPTCVMNFSGNFTDPTGTVVGTSTQQAASSCYNRTKFNASWSGTGWHNT